MSTTKETTELLKALAKLAVRTVTDLRDDGKISFAEGIGYLADISVVREGFAGLNEIPKEFADLDTEEMQALRALIVDNLREIGVTASIQDITDELLQWLYDTVKMVMRVKSKTSQPHP